jgi:hypothetical protein
MFEELRGLKESVTGLLQIKDFTNCIEIKQGTLLFKHFDLQ